VVCLVAGIDAPPGEDRVRSIRHALRAAVPDSLAGFHSDRVILLLSGLKEFGPAIESVLPALGDGPAVVGPQVDSLAEVPRSIRAANAALDAHSAWPAAPRPVAADDLLPERLLVGDPEARETLLTAVYRPLADLGQHVVDTLAVYLELGRSLEGSARQLFVHPNTVRYRLGKITDTCGWDPTSPREAYVLQHALAVGRLPQRARP
jgi:DNA-binding PucR family transcriptional regulator